LDKRTRGGFGRYTSSSVGKKIMRGRKIDEGGSGGSFIAGGERKKEGGGLGRQSRGGWDGGGTTTVEEGGPTGDQDTVVAGAGEALCEQGKPGVADMWAMAIVTGGPLNGIQTHSMI
jgi:hypothetical protein